MTIVLYIYLNLHRSFLTDAKILLVIAIRSHVDLFLKELMLWQVFYIVSVLLLLQLSQAFATRKHKGLKLS